MRDKQIINLTDKDIDSIIDSRVLSNVEFDHILEHMSASFADLFDTRLGYAVHSMLEERYRVKCKLK